MDGLPSSESMESDERLEEMLCVSKSLMDLGRPSMRITVESREAKEALESLRSHAPLLELRFPHSSCLFLSSTPFS